MDTIFTNNFKLHPSVAVWCVNSDYDLIPSDNVISATSLFKPTRQIILSKRIPSVTMDVMDTFKANRGSAIHSAIEHSWLHNYKTNLTKLGYPQEFIDRVKINPTEPNKDNVNVYIETRFSKKVLNWTVSGKVDMVFNGSLIDFKTTSTYTFINKTKVKDYILQGSIYRFLAPEVITSDTITINYIFTDYLSYNKGNPNYPECEIVTESYRLLPYEDTEKYIIAKLAQIDACKDLDDEFLPLCTDEELWKEKDTWKYFPKEDSVKCSKRFDSEFEAKQYLASKNGKGYLKLVRGKPRRCTYCPCAPICNQYARINL